MDCVVFRAESKGESEVRASKWVSATRRQGPGAAGPVTTETAGLNTINFANQGTLCSAVAAALSLPRVSLRPRGAPAVQAANHAGVLSTAGRGARWGLHPRHGITEPQPGLG